MWLVDGLIPLGKMLQVLAQAGVGKSYWVEGLAVAVTFEQPFMGLETIGGDVLIIDEDSPTDTLQIRLAKFGKHYMNVYKIQAKHKLFVRSMTGVSMRAGGLAKMILQYPTVKLVVIDSLTGVSSGVELCKGSEAMVLARLKVTCLRPDLTIIFTHHITEKRELPVDVLMMCDPHALTMYSSVINQQMDGYYIAGSPDTDGILRQLCIRPISKRVALRQKSFVCSLYETEEYLNFSGCSAYDIKNIGMLRDIESDVMALFETRPNEHITVRQIDTLMGGIWGVNSLRDVLFIMRKKELLHLEKGHRNQFRFSLCKNGSKAASLPEVEDDSEDESEGDEE
jgi:hypothetical protein